MMDLSLLAALSDFARKRPPRNICTKGIAARGWFQPYMELSEFTAAKIFTDPDAKIPTIVRFSLFSGLPGAADTRRDLRCMDVKFLTDEGEFDLLSGSFPRFFVQDPGKIPELMKALQPEPGSGTGDRDALWKFAAAHPEAMPAMLWLYSDRGTAKSYDQPEYWGLYPLALKNEDGETFLMDWKWEPEQGFSTITSGEAEFYAGFDPDAAGRDLREKLQGEKPLKWELLLKIRTPDGLEEQWIHAGKLILMEVLDRETEDTLLFLPHTLPKGIFPTDDPLAEGLTWLLQEEHRQRVHHSCEASTSLRSTSLADSSASITSEPPLCKGSRPAVNSEPPLSRGGARRAEGLPQQERLLHNLTQDLLFLDEATQEAIINHIYKLDQGLAEQLSRRL